MSGLLQDKVALVTGGSSGIGRATALAFAREGAKVVITARRIKESEETVRMIKEAGGEGIYIKTDVSQRSEVETLVLKTVERYGRLDFALNNAGIDAEWALTADCTDENWDKVISINLKGVWLCMQYEIRQMLKQGGGAIVNMASGQAFVAEPNMAAYVVSKHGVLGLTRAAAVDYAASGIRVNVVCPGIIRTELVEKGLAAAPGLEAEFVAKIPMKRMGSPEQIAGAVVWLCTDAASYMTGQSIIIDGGQLVKA